MKKPFSTCVHPDGYFVYGIHKPSYTVNNRRINNQNDQLGMTIENQPVLNSINFPKTNVTVEAADWVYEIPNPFPFKGVTYINKKWADNSANNPERFYLQAKPNISLHNTLKQENIDPELITKLPRSLKLALATTSNDSQDLIALAKLSCEMIFDDNENPTGLIYQESNSGKRAVIHDFHLFEAVANNPHLPDIFKIVMVIKPGAQGASEITAEWQKKSSHAYEYLRTNSYITGGHYAANMSEDAIRYSIDDFSKTDIQGLRHLYYQRTYIRLAEELGLNLPANQTLLSQQELEKLRQAIISAVVPSVQKTKSRSTLWGWNFGFDYAPTEYRLHASHQQIHQQYAMIPNCTSGYTTETNKVTDSFHSYSCGDFIADTISRYHKEFDRSYFLDYLQAIYNNQRMDDRTDLNSEIIIWSDENVLLFVPKAQTSQWEVQIMTKPDQNGNFIGNILEASASVRESLDLAILKAQQALAGLGARMVTSIEYPKEFCKKDKMQPLIYALLPRLPESPGAFSEAQLRFINGHYPEDFAKACRKSLTEQNKIQ